MKRAARTNITVAVLSHRSSPVQIAAIAMRNPIAAIATPDANTTSSGLRPFL
jgi:hypothetical protein